LEDTNIITVWNKVDVFDNADMVNRIRAEAASRMKTVAGTLLAIPLSLYTSPC
jgi:50S ribosomal subunit-associated GTPase HflX